MGDDLWYNAVYITIAFAAPPHEYRFLACSFSNAGYKPVGVDVARGTVSAILSTVSNGNSKLVTFKMTVPLLK